jgi:hypothetical protein
MKRVEVVPRALVPGDRFGELIVRRKLDDGHCAAASVGHYWYILIPKHATELVLYSMETVLSVSGDLRRQAHGMAALLGWGVAG